MKFCLICSIAQSIHKYIVIIFHLFLNFPRVRCRQNILSLQKYSIYVPAAPTPNDKPKVVEGTNPTTSNKVVIENLVVEDYVQGPVVDELNKLGEMWVFGKDVKEREVYIKITLGKGASALCISFHIAEHPMNYPFK